jgi:hypothetical protein
VRFRSRLLRNSRFFAFNLAQSKKDDPGQIALYARLFGDCFAQVNGEAQRYPRTVVRPPLSLVVHFPNCLLCCFLNWYWMPFHDLDRNGKSPKLRRSASEEFWVYGNSGITGQFPFMPTIANRRIWCG